MNDNLIENKSFDFAIRIVNLCKFLTTEKKEYALSKQILKSGTSIGANVSESQYAQSEADFLSKNKIALKEANETEYWLKLLYRTEYIDSVQYNSMYNDLNEIIKILTSICKTLDVRTNKQ